MWLTWIMNRLFKGIKNPIMKGGIVDSYMANFAACTRFANGTFDALSVTKAV